ncbi:Sugar carrier protein C [Hibiscus syriacus]|uniref:Sugar carrier protein C n=1 Tax=Hibiscus syriacus TaxID=106335 RepID=A0A6A3BFR8_HIBSY|nr:Sugar carrier protein C [Hibiscus syriacus]
MLAAGGIGPGNGKEYAGNLTPFVTVTCIVAAMGVLIFGYDIGISVTTMVPFLQKFFRKVWEKKEANNSTVTRKLGRRLSMLFGGLLFFAGALINGFAKAVWMLIVGRMLLGFGVAFSNQSTPLYLSEMATYRYRGALNIERLGLATEFGWCYAPCPYHHNWIPTPPDTPNSMIEHGQIEEARLKLKRICGTKYRPHLTMVILIPFFQQLTGINVIMFYAPVLFNTIGFGDDASLMSAVITAACIGYKFEASGNPGDLPKWYVVVVVVFISVYVAGFAWSWGPLGWLVPSEIFPLEIRSAAQSVNVSVNMIFTFLVAQLFLTTLWRHLKFGLFLFFALFVVIMSIFIYYSCQRRRIFRSKG